MRRQRLIGVLLLVVSTTLSLGAGELVYRAYRHRLYRRQVAEFPSRSWLLLPDSPREFGLRPDWVGKITFQNDPEKSVPYRTNSAGFRDREIGAKRPSVPRVVVLGDSYTFGWAVLEEETYPKRAEALLAADRRTVEILNLGVPGYNTEQEVALLEQVFPTLRPDIVVVGYAMNDAEPQMNVPTSPAVTYRWAFSWMWEDAKELLRAHWRRGASWLPDRRYLASGAPYGASFDARSPKSRASKVALSRIAEICRQGNAALAVLILPDVTEHLDDDYRDARIHAVVAAWGKELGIDTIDLLPRLRDRDHLGWSVEGDGHPNARAHEEFALALRDEVVSLLERRGR